MNIKDYLHLYLGCEIQFFSDFDGKFHKGKLSAKCLDWAYQPAKRVKPLLRPLSDMTEEELDELAVACGEYDKFANLETLLGALASDGELEKVGTIAYVNHYLLQKGFDLFGLIPAGLAIDKTQQTA